MVTYADVLSRYSLDKSVLIEDLSNGLPQWILSVYAPGREAPAQLFEGDMLEQSFEEMRFRHYVSAVTGRPQDAIQDAESLVTKARQHIQTALNDPEGALRYVIVAANNHPNRLDRVGKLNSTFSQVVGPVQQPPNQPPGFANHALSVGGVAAGGGFRAPSALATNGPAFGRPSALVSGTAFGQPSGLGSGTAFGQPSGLGSGTAFGQPSALGSGTTFGQPSALGVNSGIGRVVQPSTGFGPSTGGSGFGQPSSLSQPIQPGAQSASKPNPFSSTPTQNGPASQTQTQGDAFGTNGFASAALPAPFSNTQPPGASMDPRTFSTRDASNRLLTWKSKPVTYVDDEPCYTRDDDGTYERIWFPAGPPPVDESCELPLEMYDEKTKAAYLYVRDHGEFKDGWIPPLPPRREWCRFDL